MKEYKIDIEKSEKLLNDNRQLIVQKECYDNIYRLVSNLRVSEKEVRVVFGAVYLFKGMYAKHCFLMVGDKVVDPTLMLRGEENCKKSHYIVAKKLTMEQYTELLCKCGYTDLGMYMRKYWDKVRNQLGSVGKTLVG